MRILARQKALRTSVFGIIRQEEVYEHPERGIRKLLVAAREKHKYDVLGEINRHAWRQSKHQRIAQS
jgi:hypothetical protein